MSDQFEQDVLAESEALADFLSASIGTQWPVPDSQTATLVKIDHTALARMNTLDAPGQELKVTLDKIANEIAPNIKPHVVEKIWEVDENKFMPINGLMVLKQTGDVWRPQIYTALHDDQAENINRDPNSASLGRVKTFLHELFHYYHYTGVLSRDEIEQLEPYHREWLREHDVVNRNPQVARTEGLEFRRDTLVPGGRLFGEAAASSFGSYALSRFTPATDRPGGHRRLFRERRPDEDPVRLFDTILSGDVGRRPRAYRVRDDGIDTAYSAGNPQQSVAPLKRPRGRGLVQFEPGVARTPTKPTENTRKPPTTKNPPGMER